MNEQRMREIQPLMTQGSRPLTRLYVRSNRSPERILLTRLAMLITMVAMIMAILWYDRDGLRDQIDGEISFSDVAYFTAVTLTTVGYGDIVPVTDRARIMDALLVTPLRLVIWLVFLGTAYELVLQRWLEARRMTRLQTRWTNTSSSAASDTAGKVRPGRRSRVGLDRLRCWSLTATLTASPMRLTRGISDCWAMPPMNNISPMPASSERKLCWCVWGATMPPYSAC
jgi:hypothetical protein